MAGETSNPDPAKAVDRYIRIISWLIAIGAVIAAIYLGQTRDFQLPFSQTESAGADAAAPTPTQTVASSTPRDDVRLPPFHAAPSPAFLSRTANPHTQIPTRPRAEIVKYTVRPGDSVFGIANSFGIKPETLLWANYDLLNDNPDFLELDMELNVPPVDGVYYQWQEGDTLEDVAARFKTSLEAILEFPSNQVDLANPVIDPGQMVMIPGGEREFRQWLIPAIPRGSAGVNTTALGPGACSGSYDGAYGSGAFVWPSSNHFLSGNDYWSGHLGIDLAAGEGAPIYAADAGVIVFSGWANGGYGNTIMIDHGNGYQTLYAHLSSVSVGCGQSVAAGNTVGYAGSTGNSTGAHLHFEVRLNGGFINPWFVLPAP